MHSESNTIHQQAVELFRQPGLENSFQYELRHKEIIDCITEWGIGSNKIVTLAEIKEN